MARVEPRFYIPRRLLSEIESRVIKAHPTEDCGLLSGLVLDGSYLVDGLWPSNNLLAHLPGRFEVDPGVRLQAEKACRAQGKRMLGHWHSHPNGLASPSAIDLAQAYEPDLIWLILGCNGEKVVSEATFLPPRTTDSGFTSVALEIV